MAEALDVQPILECALDGALDAVKVSFGGVYVLADDGAGLTLKAHRAPASFERLLEHVRTLGAAQLLIRDVVSHRRVVKMQLADFLEDPVATALFSAGVENVVLVPVISVGSVVGLLALGLPPHSAVGTWQEDFLLSVAGRIGVAISRERAHMELAKQATELLQRNRELVALNKLLQEHQAEERPCWEKIGALVRELSVEADRVRDLHSGMPRA